MSRKVFWTVVGVLAVSAAAAYGDDSSSYAIGAAPEGVFFSHGSKLYDLVKGSEWLIKGGSGLIAITCFASSGNLARQGEYGRAGGALLGGVIVSIGAYLVHMVQS